MIYQSFRVFSIKDCFGFGRNPKAKEFPGFLRIESGAGLSRLRSASLVRNDERGNCKAASFAGMTKKGNPIFPFYRDRPLKGDPKITDNRFFFRHFASYSGPLVPRCSQTVKAVK